MPQTIYDFAKIASILHHTWGVSDDAMALRLYEQLEVQETPCVNSAVERAGVGLWHPVELMTDTELWENIEALAYSISRLYDDITRPTINNRTGVSMDINTKEGMEQAIAWTQNHLQRLNSGGAWVIPRSGTIVRVYHTAKLAAITPGFAPDPSIPKVLEAMGWTVIYPDGEEVVAPFNVV